MAAGPTRGFFDAWSWVYDFPPVQRATYRPVHDAVLRALVTEPCGRLLDLGCGTGRLAARVVASGSVDTVVGCDFSAGMLARAAERLHRTAPSGAGGAHGGGSTNVGATLVRGEPSANVAAIVRGGATLVRADAGRLPFAAAAFDAVVSTDAFHWFPDQAAALAEIRRVLRPGGRLLLALVSPTVALAGEAVRLAMRLVGQPVRWTSAAGLAAELRAAGFAVEAQHRVFRLPGLLLPPIVTVARRPR